MARVTKDSDQIFTARLGSIRLNHEMDSPLEFPLIDSLAQFEKEWQHSEPQYTLAAQSLLAYKYVKDSNYVAADTILKRIAPLFPLVTENGYKQYYIKARTKKVSALWLCRLWRKLVFHGLRQQNILN